ncbi:MAG: penicillin acylase family protein [Candidatus Hydrogenedentes bacterium]|nr:penicillin acylase family protein [Candidatus Hydrogenedentota bacterium]
MKSFKTRAILCGCAAVLASFAYGGAPAHAENTGEATLYRDEWGVPYIYGGSDADAAFALGYAQAQDRLEDIFVNVRTGIGRMAEVFGKEHVQSDYIMRMIKNEEMAASYWEKAPDHLKAAGEAFVRGIEKYMSEHPEEAPESALELKPWYSLAIMRAMIMNWPLGAINDDLNKKSNTLGWGSNEWSVRPERSAEKCAVLLTDPHLTWKGMSVFYEAHVYGDMIPEQHGYFLMGVYFLGFGHGSHVGWAPTTGGPDTGDVFAMKINPQNPLQYEYDGEWRNAELGQIEIPVKGGETVKMPTYRTHLGLAFAEPDIQKQMILVGATPYFDAEPVLEQSVAMLQAKNAGEFYEALKLNQLMEQNIMFADRDGNTQYVRVGRTPIRPDGYDWNAPVPGNISASAWTGIHSLDDLVQIKNPPQGYMQNCNISPQFMMLDSPMTPDKYPSYIYNVSWDLRNSRGDRALQALSEDDSLTKEEAMDLAFDITEPYYKEWQAALKAAAQGVGQNKLRDDKSLKDAVDRILAWNGQYHKDNRTAPLVRTWKLLVFKEMDGAPINRAKKLELEAQMKLIDALAQAVTGMKTLYGTTDVAWGDIIKVGRGDTIVPASGADFGGGEGDKSVRTLLSLGVKPLDEAKGTYVAQKGSMAMMLMFMHKDGVESYTCIPWGQSGHPDSPHYMDQGEKLFSERKFKKVYQTRDELKKHVESELALKSNG